MEWLKGKSYPFESWPLLTLSRETIPQPLKPINFHPYVKPRVRPGRSSNSPYRSPHEGLTGTCLPQAFRRPPGPLCSRSLAIPSFLTLLFPLPSSRPRSRHRFPAAARPDRAADRLHGRPLHIPSGHLVSSGGGREWSGEGGGGGHATRNRRGPTLASRGRAGRGGSAGQPGRGAGSSEGTAAAAMADHEAGMAPKARRTQGNRGRGERGCPRGAAGVEDPQPVAAGGLRAPGRFCCGVCVCVLFVGFNYYFI